MGQFKKGDWVLRVKPSDYPREFGEVGKVYKVLDVNAFGDVVVIAGKTSTAYAFEPWQPKVGERVRVVYGNGWDGEAEVYDVDDEDAYVKMSSGLHAGDRGGFTFSEIEPVTDTPPVAEQPAALTIQAGRYYKTRDGRKVGPMEFLCRDSNRKGRWIAVRGDGRVWYTDGKWAADYQKGEDLVAEWVDTPDTPVHNITAATVDAINDEYGPVVAVEKPVAKQPARLHEGAKVRLVRNRNAWNGDCDPLVIGEIVTLTNRDTGISNQTTWEAWNVKEKDIVAWVRSDDVELITSAPAIVALIENGQPLPATRPAVHTSAEAADAEARRLAGVHKGQEFGVFTLGVTHKVARVYEHEWQRLAVGGEKINAIRELRAASGLGLATAKTAVEDWLRREAA